MGSNKWDLAVKVKGIQHCMGFFSACGTIRDFEQCYSINCYCWFSNICDTLGFCRLWVWSQHSLNLRGSLMYSYVSRYGKPCSQWPLYHVVNVHFFSFCKHTILLRHHNKTLYFCFLCLVFYYADLIFSLSHHEYYNTTCIWLMNF